ncbi:6-carboxytetrahydropterin synthase QueD [Neisseriaceae bacterium PsAf]|nr:6-carboxytetrahydropterin synthase QueD [Neisseriaceae bacterium PsAf]
MSETFKITKEFRFEIAHLLDGHDGKCQNLHGHGYVLQVELTDILCSEGPKEGMVFDFGDLKEIVEQEIVLPMDHSFIYDTRSERESKIAQVLIECHSKVYGVPFRTTAELIAQHIFKRLKQNNLPISAVRLWESAHSFCEYRP